MGLASFLGVPRRLVLAGVPYEATELRLRDLASLEALVLGRPGGDPWAALAGARAQGETAARRRLLRQAYDAAEAEADGIGGRGTLDALESDGAQMCLLRAVLRKHRPRPTTADLLSLIAAMSDDDRLQLERAAFGGDARSAAAAAIDAELGIVLPTPPDGDGPTWPEAAISLARKLRLSPARLASLGDLTLSQVRALLGGEGSPATEVPHDRIAQVSKLRSEFWAEEQQPDEADMATRQIIHCDRCGAECPHPAVKLRIEHAEPARGPRDLCGGCAGELEGWMTPGEDETAPEPTAPQDPAPTPAPADEAQPAQ
jgi:hypothetical protein